MTTTTQQPRADGFTLIELLVAVAVVIVLMAILLPVLASAREKGRGSVCLSHERQLGLGMLQYLQDNNETFPVGAPTMHGDTFFAGVGWAGDCLPYVKDTRLFQCPDDGTQPFDGGFVVSYAINCNLGGVSFHTKKTGAVLFPAASFSKLTAPAKTVLLFEVSDNVTHLVPSTPGTDWDSPSGNTATDAGYFSLPSTPAADNWSFPMGGGGTHRFPPDYAATLYATGNIGGRVLNGPEGSAPRHGDGANYVACDGHCLWLRPEQVSGGADAMVADCRQGTESHQPPGCSSQVTPMAAGTADGEYALTFSTK